VQQLLRTALSATLALLALIVTTDSLIMAAAILGGDATVLRFLSGASGLLTAVVLAAALIGAPMVLRAVSGLRARRSATCCSATGPTTG
jgi:hypothetical protein